MLINGKDYDIKPHADLHGADLTRADLTRANLHGAKNIPVLTAAQSLIVPETGSYEAWKKCSDVNFGTHPIVHLLVPSEARRSNATGRKCRAEFVKVLEIIGGTVAISNHDGKTQYRVGETVRCDKWEENRWIECGGGIHHFITRAEAEAY